MKIPKINLSYLWKERLLDWGRTISIVLAMWSIWLIREYVPDLTYANILTGFQIGLIFMITMFSEYNRKRDSRVKELEADFKRLKKD